MENNRNNRVGVSALNGLIAERLIPIQQEHEGEAFHFAVGELEKHLKQVQLCKKDSIFRRPSGLVINKSYRRSRQINIAVDALNHCAHFCAQFLVMLTSKRFLLNRKMLVVKLFEPLNLIKRFLELLVSQHAFQ